MQTPTLEPRAAGTTDTKQSPPPDFDCVATARAHAQSFLKRADQLDATAGFPHENFADMRSSQLLMMALPEIFGGKDASLLDCAQVLHEIAGACPSTALIFNMHLAFTMQLAHMWRIEKSGVWAELLTQISTSQSLVGGALSESSSWNAALYPQTRAVPVQGGYRVTGTRSFCTGSHHLDLIQCTAAIETETHEKRAMYFVLDGTADGLVWKDDWNTLGMRGSASQGFRLEDVFVPHEAVLYTYPYGEMDLSQIWLSFLATSFIGFASVYSGIAEYASQYAIDLVRARQRAPGTHPLIHKPALQRHAAQALIKIETMKAVREDIGRRTPIGHHYTLGTIIDTAIAKHMCVNDAIETVDHAVAVIGGQAYFKTLRLERLLRDVRAGPFHPFSQDDSVEMLGKLAFGLSFMEPPGWAL